jgi:hypothetical protein
VHNHRETISVSQTGNLSCWYPAEDLIGIFADL